MKSRLTFSIAILLGASEAARDARHVALPAGPEGEHEEVADERALLAERDRLPAALAGHLAEAGAHLLVELGKRRDLLQLLVVEPAGHLPLELLVQHQAHVDRAHHAAPGAPVGDQLVDGGHVLRVGRRAADQDDDLLRVGAPLELAHRALEAVLHRLLPVAAALGHDAVEEALHLLHVEGEGRPLDDEGLALPRAAGRVAVVAVAVGDRADARRRHQALHGGCEVVHAPLQVVDHVLHAAGRVDDEGDVEPDLPEAAHVPPEGGAERPAGAPAALADAEAAHAGGGTTIAWAVVGLSSSLRACSAFGSFGGTGAGRSSSANISRRRFWPRPMPPPEPMPKPAPRPSPKPPPAPRMSKKIMRPRSAWAAVEIPSAASRRRGRGAVVVSNGAVTTGAARAASASARG